VQTDVSNATAHRVETLSVEGNMIFSG